MNRVQIPFKILQLFFIISISVMVGYYFGVNKVNVSWSQYKPIVSIDSKAPPQGVSLDMSLFYDSLDKVEKDYFDRSKIDSQKILFGAISGMLTSLEDPYTSFFPPKQNQAFKEVMAGEFGGIGAELGLNKDNIVMIVAPMDGSPAQKAGVKIGDLVLRVNDQDTNGWTISQAVEKIRGLKGTKVKIMILHEGEKVPTEVSIVRDTIQIDSVRSWVKTIKCNNGSCEEIKTKCNTCAKVGYIRISQFGDKTNQEWLKAVNNISNLTFGDQNFKGIVLDVRSNPGGYLTDAVFIASEFVDNGPIVLQENNKGDRVSMDVNRKGLFLKMPLVVLINKGSASASEIVSGALRDYGRAKLIGENSFGKGTVQEAIEVGHGASIHLSVAKWLTPKGNWVHKTGLKPDIEIKFDEKSASNPAAFDNQLQGAIKELVR